MADEVGVPRVRVIKPTRIPTIYSVGHSNRTMEDFIAILRAYSITRLYDVRTYPYSKYVSQFNKIELAQRLLEVGINYTFAGEVLGGKSNELYKDCNDTYDQSILRIIRKATKENVVVMCTEKDHQKCHRFTKLTPSILKLGGLVSHIGGGWE